jgi:RNA polymerase sigma-70 factor (ECF subfamily)
LQYKTLSDEQLAEKYVSGDPNAMTAIYERYVDKIYRLAYSKLGNNPDAQDVTSTVFLKLCTFLQSFRGESKLSTWIFAVTANAAIDLIRHRKPQDSLDREIEGKDGESMGLQVATPNPGPEQLAEKEDFRRFMFSIVQKLPDMQKQILELRFLVGMSYQEISEELGIEMGTVKSRINRAVASLRDAYTRSEVRNHGL